MRKFFGRVFLYVCVAFLGDQVECRDSFADNSDISKELTPIPGWNRYSGDSARSLSGWFRWWTYLNMKEPETIDWICGLKLKIYPGNEIFRALFVRGVYDPNLIIVVNALLKKGSVFIDVGANMGYFSLLASQVVGKDGKIFALEPSSRDFARLQDNIKTNNLQKIIFPLQLAISDKVSLVNLSIACEERSGLNTMGSEFSSKGTEKVEVQEVGSTTIDKFMNRKHIDKVNVLKLDIEGSEVDALRGAVNTIEKCRPAIMLGVNPVALNACGSSVDELQKIIKSMNYKIYIIVDDPVFALKEVEDISKIHTKVVFCLPESAIPPALPQPKEQSIADRISDFFLR
jgi:FkbM family methyltransferase